MSRHLPQDVALTIHRIQEAGRYLDNLAENVVDQATANVARAHANAVWDAAGQVETLARMIRDVLPMMPGVES